MWILTPICFVSIVSKDPSGQGRLCVRARVCADLTRLAKLFKAAGYPTSRIERSDTNDYEYRFYAQPDHVAAVMGELVKNITYSNFKDEVHKVNAARATIYMRVWSVLHSALDKREPWWKRYASEMPVTVTDPDRHSHGAYGDWADDDVVLGDEDLQRLALGQETDEEWWAQQEKDEGTDAVA